MAKKAIRQATSSRKLAEAQGAISPEATDVSDVSDRNAESLASRWTFLTNHAHVLILLHANPEMILRQVASTVGITERAVQRIVMDLEAGGYIRREKIGRQNRYQVLTDVPLRHSIESHRKIGDLLRLISG